MWGYFILFYFIFINRAKIALTLISNSSSLQSFPIFWSSETHLQNQNQQHREWYQQHCTFRILHILKHDGAAVTTSMTTPTSTRHIEIVCPLIDCVESCSLGYVTTSMAVHCVIAYQVCQHPWVYALKPVCTSSARGIRTPCKVTNRWLSNQIDLN